MSWSSRQLETLVQRVEVLRIFATSKLWYKASALPLPNKFAKKFETAMLHFLWIGKLEKLKIDEIKNPVLSGGLDPPCVISKSDSLFLSQTCRLLKITESKQYCHVKYWLGIYVRDYFPDMAQGPHAEILTPYFQHMRALLVGGLTLGDFSASHLNLVTAKNLYLGFTSTFPPPKVTLKYDIEWEKVWGRLQNPVLEPMSREVLFMIVHNIVANKDRVHKFNMTVSPNCPACGVVQDNVHLFCQCLSVREAWFWIRQRVLGMLPADCGVTSDFELLHLMFASNLLENEIVWLLGVYVQLVWDQVVCKKNLLNQQLVKVECAQQYLNHHASNKPDLAHIMGIFQ